MRSPLLLQRSGAGIIAASGQRAEDANLTKTGQICQKLRMPVSSSARRISVSPVAVPEVSAAIVYEFHEIVTSVGTMWEPLTGERQAVGKMNPGIVAKPLALAMAGRSGSRYRVVLR